MILFGELLCFYSLSAQLFPNRKSSIVDHVILCFLLCFLLFPLLWL